MTTHEIITLKAQLPVYFDIYHSDNQLVPSHWHNHLEVLYLLEGTFTIVRNDEKYTMNKYDLFVVNSCDIHYTRSIGNADIMLLQIPYEFLSQCMYQYSAIHFKEYYSYDELKEDATYLNMIKYLFLMGEHYKQGDEGYQFLFCSNLQLFLHSLYTYYSTRQNLVVKNKDSKHLARFREIIVYVEDHYMEPLTLTQAASLVAINPEYFCRSFKKYMGFSFMEYVNLVRLTHIHNDILKTEDNITTIQDRHGFNNYKVFNRMFKDVYGCSPSKLRSSNK